MFLLASIKVRFLVLLVILLAISASKAFAQQTTPQILYGNPTEAAFEGTRYYAPAFNFNVGSGSSFEERAVVAPTAFTLSDFFCAYQGDSINDFGPAGSSAVFTVMKNGAPTALSGTVTGTSGTDRNCAPFPNTASVSFQQGDLLGVRIVSSGASTSPPGRLKWSMKLQPQNSGERVLMTMYSSS